MNGFIESVMIAGCRRIVWGMAPVIVSMGLAHAASPWERHTIDASSEGADGVRLMDVNGDGFNDIATAWEEGGIVRTYRHPGLAKVKEPWPAVTVGEVTSGEDAVFVDLDGDGAVDVVSSCEGRTRRLHVHWAPKEQDRVLDPGAWQTEAIPCAEKRMMWMYALPMEVDGLHGIDLVVAGKGKDAEIGWLRAPENPRDLAAWTYETIAPMGWVMSMKWVDMDGDGEDDILYSDRKGATRGIYWIAREAGQWRRHAIPNSDEENMFLDTGDLDQDGRVDILCAVGGGPLRWHRRTASGWESHAIPLPPGVGTGKSAAIADVDGDGRNDVVFSCEHAHGELSGLRWLSWGESPQAGPWQSHEIGGPVGLKYDRIVLEDVDRDGDLDVLTCEERDQLGVVWYENPSLSKATSAVDEGPSRDRPNILLIMADDLGYECLGSYGGESYATPHLERLAETGTRFTQCFSTPKCSPSRVTLLSGRYTPRTTLEWGVLPPEEVTFGQVLQRAGYATALAGKWQLGRIVDDVEIVPRSGFSEYCVWGWHEGPRYWNPLIWQNGEIREDVAERYGPDVFTDFLIEFMGREREEPFLAYYPMALTHFPKKDEPKGPQGEWESFAAMVAQMDRCVGRLVEALEEKGLREKTLILFTADNGTPRNVVSRWRGREIRGGKGLLTDAGNRVPLIANWPGVVVPGVDDELIDFSDFLPTLAALARAALPERTLDGVSFHRRLYGSKQASRAQVFTEWDGQRWVRDKEWKLYDNGRLVNVAVPFAEEVVAENALPEIRLRLRDGLKAVLGD